jgi:hypothetical protein
LGEAYRPPTRAEKTSKATGHRAQVARENRLRGWAAGPAPPAPPRPGQRARRFRAGPENRPLRTHDERGGRAALSRNRLLPTRQRPADHPRPSAADEP